MNDKAPLTLVVRRRVRAGGEAAFEDAMREFIAFALASPGNRGINVLRPQAVMPLLTRVFAPWLFGNAT